LPASMSATAQSCFVVSVGSRLMENETSWLTQRRGRPDQRRDCRLSLGGIMARTPIHPGEHLAEELKELSISAAELARQIDVPVNRITGIINGQRAITADTALRLGHWFGTSPEFWLNLQKLYELRLAREEVGDRVGRLPKLTVRKRKKENDAPRLL
jgi:addiction module HigA family antidote